MQHRNAQFAPPSIRPTRRLAWLFALGVWAISGLGLSSMVASSTAWADDVLSNSPVVRRNWQLRGGRHELTAVVGATLGDPYVHDVLPGIRYDLHLRDWLAIGIDAMAGVPVETSETKTVQAKVEKINPNFTMETTHLRLLTGAHVQVAPVVGKFIAFGSLPVNFDFHINLSVGLASVTGTANIPANMSVAPGIGGGGRVFLSRVVAITADLNDVYVNRVLAVDRNSKAPLPSFQSSLVFTAGLSFFIPPDLERAD